MSDTVTPWRVGHGLDAERGRAGLGELGVEVTGGEDLGRARGLGDGAGHRTALEAADIAAVAERRGGQGRLRARIGRHIDGGLGCRIAAHGLVRPGRSGCR